MEEGIKPNNPLFITKGKKEGERLENQQITKRHFIEIIFLSHNFLSIMP